MKTTRTVNRTGKLLPHIEQEQVAMMAALDRFEDSMQVPGGTRVLIKTLAHGQSGPYRDSHHRGLIVVFGSHSSDGVPQLRSITLAQALTLGRMFVSDYAEPVTFMERRLLYCRPDPLPDGMPIGWFASPEMLEYVQRFDGSSEYRAPCWDFYVTEPYND